MFFKSRRKKPRLKYISAENILPNPFQPRREEFPSEDAELCECVRRWGILDPVTVHITRDGSYQLLSGSRRLKAARNAGFAKVPCLVVDSEGFSPLFYSVLHDLHHQPLNVFEQASALRNITDSVRISRDGVSGLLGISQGRLNSQLLTLKLNESQRQKVLSAGLSREHITAIARMEIGFRDRAIDTVIAKNLSAADTVRLAENLSSAEDKSRRRTSGVGDLRLFDNSLQRMTEALTASGIRATNIKKDNDSYVEYTVRIYKPERGRSAERAEKQLALF